MGIVQIETRVPQRSSGSPVYHVNTRIVITWINFMYFKFGHINILPSREVIDRTMPEAFKKKIWFNSGHNCLQRFTISDLLPLSVSLYLPPFIGGLNQMPTEGIFKTQEIASLSN